MSTSLSVETMKIYLFKESVAVVSRGSGCDGDRMGAGHKLASYVVLKYELMNGNVEKNRV